MDDSGTAPAGAPASEVRHGIIGLLRSGDAQVKQSAAVLATARGGAEIGQSLSGAVVSGGDTAIRLSAAVAVPSLGDVSIEKGGAQWVVSAGDVSIEKGGCAAAVAPRVSVDHGAVGVALGWHVDVGENSRVLLGPLAAVGLGLAFGLGVGVVAAASAGFVGWQAWKRRPKLPWLP